MVTHFGLVSLIGVTGLVLCCYLMRKSKEEGGLRNALAKAVENEAVNNKVWPRVSFFLHCFPLLCGARLSFLLLNKRIFYVCVIVLPYPSGRFAWPGAPIQSRRKW